MQFTKLEASIDGIIDGGRCIPAERRAQMAISSGARGNGYFILILATFIAALWLLSRGSVAFAQQAVFLVRHADR
jgi:hypothetical protein